MDKLSVIKQNFFEAREILDAYMNEPENWKSLARAGDMMIECIRGGGKILSCGNGGSMCDAMHFAEEMTGRFRENRRALPAISISDASHMSCTANDYGYNYIFSRYIDAFGKKGDILLAISTSGNSPNILEAVSSAHMLGMKVVALTGKTGGTLASCCDVQLKAPQTQWSDRAQEIHIKIIHSLIQYIELGLEV
jgi:D-sedoheptulose 7-phosphate isomerase